jgi:predicted GH43/DUF377 family glycosyl hydrolase
MLVVTRAPENPILSPALDRPWECVATFNPAPVQIGSTTHIFYRALAKPDLMLTPYAGRSTVGYARAEGRGEFGGRRQVIVPTEAWEHFGCEDPRATFFEGKWYVFYTAIGGYPFNAGNIKVAVAVGSSPERLDEKHLVTPFNAKAAALFPERINGKVALILTAHTDAPPVRIVVALADNVSDFWASSFWEGWDANLDARAVWGLVSSNSDFCEVGGVPVKTDRGWLLTYSRIQNYGQGGQVFGIDFALLDLDDPRKVLGRTEFPVLTPEEPCERYGIVPDIAFPSGLTIEGDVGTIYYGGADTVCARARFSVPHLLDAMDPERRNAFAVRENGGVPLLSPVPEHKWEARAVLNPAALDTGDAVHLLYRAVSPDNDSVLGYARLGADGLTLEARSPEPAYVPRADFERRQGGVGSGCEDARLVAIDGRVHVCYTAYDGVSPWRGAHSSIPLEDFVAGRFENWSEPRLLTPDVPADKDVCVFPEKVGGQFLLAHRVDPVICLEHLDELPPKEPVRFCTELMGPRRGMWDSVKIGAAGPPIRVPAGWLFVYHAVGGDHVYRLGAVLLDGETGTTILARTSLPIAEPILDWERRGEVGNVVFACGAAIRGDRLILYYGGADSSVGAMSVSLAALMDVLASRA